MMMVLTRSFRKPVQRRATADPVFAKELIKSMTEACEHAEGKPGRVRVLVFDVPDVRAIRPPAAGVANGIRAGIPDSARDHQELGAGTPAAGYTGRGLSAGDRQAAARGVGKLTP
jgi:hypothetical protein